MKTLLREIIGGKQIYIESFSDVDSYQLALEKYFKVHKLDGKYFLYHLTEVGKMSPIKFLCTIDSKTFQLGSNLIPKNIDDLVEQVNKHVNELPYNSEFYNPQFRDGYFEELVINEYLFQIGFKHLNTNSIGSGDNATNFSTYEFEGKNIYGGTSTSYCLSFIGLDSICMNKIPEIVEISYSINDSSWVSVKCKRNVDDIKNAINSLIKPLFLSDSVLAFNTSEKIEDVENLEIILNKLIINKNISALSVSYKQTLKDKMKELMDKL